MKKKRNEDSRAHWVAGITRALTIWAEIESGLYPSNAELAEQLGVTTRTIKRDMAALRKLFNAPFAYDRGFGGWYCERLNVDLFGAFKVQRERFKETKRCSRCRAEKALTQFYPDPRTRTKRQSQCKACYLERRRLRRVAIKIK